MTEPKLVIEDFGSGRPGIEGAHTSITAIIGDFNSTVANQPVALTNVADLENKLGDESSASAQAVAQFFANGGSKCWVLRAEVADAPAGVQATLTGVLSLDYSLSETEANRLNRHGVKCLRAFPNTGPVCWGARTLSANIEWKYVPVRRLALFIEESIYQSTQWVVFEPNGEPLWANVRAVIEDFLVGLFRQGALAGFKPEQAFFVKCDRTTMTQNDLDNGRLIALVGISPLKPAEFVIIRIELMTAEPTHAGPSHTNRFSPTPDTFHFRLHASHRLAIRSSSWNSNYVAEV